MPNQAIVDRRISSGSIELQGRNMPSAEMEAAGIPMPVSTSELRRRNRALREPFRPAAGLDHGGYALPASFQRAAGAEAVVLLQNNHHACDVVAAENEDAEEFPALSVGVVPIQ